ncbi:leucine-rich repeat domain-containing protein, partial [Flavobacterium sp.]|uniref:leucine-rich repeat domain-containing protein n=1 Tax=Flavobacterium sp. TaxID=239 RepID=UPI0037BF8BBB
MKKLLFLVLLLSNFLGYSQYTLIPDVNFEKALIKKLIDTGTPDGKVLTANIIGVTDLNISSEGVTDLNGLESFVNLKTFYCSYNFFTSLDLSKNTFLEYLDCSSSILTSLDVSKNLKLSHLDCEGNQLTNLDVSKNTALEYLNCGGLKSNNIDVSKNSVLGLLICRRSQLSSLDVSNNKLLSYIDCIYNNLINLNLKNGNNLVMGALDVLLQFNPNLRCIQVDNAAYSDTYWYYRKDATANYSDDCGYKTTAPTPLKITATGNQSYCPGTAVNIAETVDIAFDPTDPNTDAVSIQIASGYVFGQDLLTLTGFHPTISFDWVPSEGKLKLFSTTGVDIPYTDFEAAIADVKFSNSSPSPTGTRTFSISLGSGQLSYLPRNKHFYEYV